MLAYFKVGIGSLSADFRERIWAFDRNQIIVPSFPADYCSRSGPIACRLCSSPTFQSLTRARFVEEGGKYFAKKWNLFSTASRH